MIHALLAAALLAQAQPKEEETRAATDAMNRARATFEYGDYAQASKLLSALLEAGRFESLHARAEAYRMLGLSLFYQGRQGEAYKAFLEYLYIEPDAAQRAERNVRQRGRRGGAVPDRRAPQRGEVGGRRPLLRALGGRGHPRRHQLQARGSASRSADRARAGAGAGSLMATLVVHAEGAAPAFVPLVKPLTTLASAPDSDVRVPDLRGVVAIQFDGESFMATALEGAQLVVNGRKRGQHTLTDGDTIQLGTTQLVFQSGERVAVPAQIRRPGSAAPESLATTRL